MDFNAILDSLLKSGRELAAKGQELAEKGLGIPESGPDRNAKLTSLATGAAAGGTLALLLGTRFGRRIAGPLILRVGGLAAIGLIGYSAYKNWSEHSGNQDVGRPINELDGEARNQRSRLLFRAMIAAANCDGQISEAERSAILGELHRNLRDGLDQSGVEQELSHPLSLNDLASSVDSMAAASEVYLSSMLVIDPSAPIERDYLNRLAAAMKLPESLQNEIESQARRSQAD